ncbi:LAFA_0F16600g1_1 [Lachancea sp. 'fantastica']|nr:LAFA_0F16600g1_1 [Lachancea sp. 'fantastica']
MSKVRTFSLSDVLGTASSSEEQKLQILAEFKGHVKKELVHEASIPQYFECLCATLNNSHGNRGAEKISILCHSTLCYLVKRVAMQCPTVLNTETIRMLMAPLLRTVHSGSKMWLGSVKALEAVYLAQPLAFEQTLEGLQLQGSDRVATLLLTDELVQLHQKNNRNPLEILNKFTGLFLSILNEPQGSRFQDYELIRDILAKYYTAQSLQDFARRVKNPDIRQLFEVTPEIPLDQISVDDDNDDDDQSQAAQNSVFDMDSELGRLLDDQPRTALPTLPRNFHNFDALRKELEHLVVPFTSAKETEHNWRQRQESIIILRGIIAGNASLEFAEETVAAFREYQITDCISKAVSSLRTSLSMHGCQLVKEMARNLGFKINPIADGIFLSLKTVLSATKKIASQNAFYAACVLLSSMQFHSRTFQSCFMLSKDKNVAPRCYAAMFLRLFLIRFNTKLDHCVIYIEEWINRSATDAQTKVRESMRVTFWYYYKIYPSNAQKLLDGFPPQIRRAVESSIPQHLGIAYTSNSVSSTETSRRSSLGPSRTPSYAGPTHSSHVQRINSIRASSGYQSSGRTKAEEQNSRKVSGSSRTSVAALRTNSGASSLERATPPRSSEDHTQIDLTGEITQNHSNTLIKKYMQRPVKEATQKSDSTLESENIIRCLSSGEQSDKELGIQLLQKVYLLGSAPQMENLRPEVAKLSTTMPQLLAPLLQLPAFLDVHPAAQIIEIFGINAVPVEVLMRRYPTDDILIALKKVLDSFFPVEDSLPLHYLKYGRQILNYTFDILIKVGKNDVSLNQPFLKHLINRLFELYGKDFDLAKYFDALSCVFAWGKDTFIDTLEAAPVFLQSNIARELEKTDPVFRSNVLGPQSDHTISNSDEEKLFTELTMINPLANQRSTSGDSVILHNLKDTQDENMPSAKSDSCDELSQDVGGFTKFGGLSKLTELTRVVSLYEHRENENNVTNSCTLDSDGDARMRSESVELKNKSTDVDLSDIFNSGKSCPKDATVKFDDIPSLIQEHDIASRDNDTQSHNGDTNTSMAMEQKISTGAEKEMLDHENVHKVHSESRLKGPELSAASNTSLKAPILLERLDEIAESFDFLGTLSSSKALQFALSNVAISSTVPYRLENLTTITAKIGKGSFTDRDLNLLLTFLIAGGKESSFIDWFRTEDGLLQLLEIHDLVSKSLRDTNDLPKTLASKCLLLSACLVILNLNLPGSSPDSLELLTMEYAWGCVLTIVRKLPRFEDELYVLCEELRNYMTSNDVVGDSILGKLAAELDMENGIFPVQQSFVLASLTMLAQSTVVEMSKDFVEEVSQKAVYFIESDHPELRKESALLLSRLYRTTRLGGGANWHILDNVGSNRAELIKSLDTNWNA